MNLLAGDILINSDKFGHVGLAIGNSRMRRNEPMDGPTCNSMAVIHATSSGIVLGNWTLKAQVFRAARLTLREALTISRIAEEIKEGATYGTSRAVFKSWSGSSSFGKDAQTRLAKYRERLRLNDAGGDKISIVKNVFCSEYVILCYQLALADTHPLFIKLDAMHSLPSTLKNHLTKDSANWRMVGEHEG